MVRSGYIGQIQQIPVLVPDGRPGGAPAPKPVPGELDYDLWLGPARWRPYCEQAHYGDGLGWAFTYDYCLGYIAIRTARKIVWDPVKETILGPSLYGTHADCVGGAPGYTPSAFDIFYACFPVVPPLFVRFTLPSTETSSDPAATARASSAR